MDKVRNLGCYAAGDRIGGILHAMDGDVRVSASEERIADIGSHPLSCT
jgi:hypothetical protein